MTRGRRSWLNTRQIEGLGHITLGLGLIISASLVIGWLLTTHRGFARLVAYRPPVVFRVLAPPVATALTALLLIDSIARVAHEWNVTLPLTSAVHRFESLPGIAEISYLASLVLLLPAMGDILGITLGRAVARRVRRESLPFRRGIELFAGLAAAFFTACQAFLWRQLPSPAAEMLSLCLAVVLVRALLLLRRTAEGFSDQLDARGSRRVVYGMIQVLLFALLQPLITLAGVLLMLLRHLPSAGKHWLRRRDHPHDVSTTLGSVEHLAANVLHRGPLCRVGFLFLVAAGAPVLLLWGLQLHPLDATLSAYPMGATIGTIYTIGFLALLLSITARHPKPFWIAAGLTAAAVGLYCPPLARAWWFDPPATPPGQSLFTLNAHALSLREIVGFIALFHGMLWGALIAIDRHGDLRVAVLDKHVYSRGRQLFWTMACSQMMVSMVCAMALVLLSQIQMGLDGYLRYETEVRASFAHMPRPYASDICAFAICVFHALGIACMATLALAYWVYWHREAPQGRSAADALVTEVLRSHGTRALEALRASTPELRFCGTSRVTGRLDMWLLTDAPFVGTFLATVAQSIIGIVHNYPGAVRAGPEIMRRVLLQH